MRTIIDLPSDMIEELAVISQQENKSRAALIREAVALYLTHKQPDDMSAAFGLWSADTVDALEYEQALRAEWE